LSHIQESKERRNDFPFANHFLLFFDQKQRASKSNLLLALLLNERKEQCSFAICKQTRKEQFALSFLAKIAKSYTFFKGIMSRDFLPLFFLLILSTLRP